MFVKSMLLAFFVVTIFAACAENGQVANNNPNEHQTLGTGDSGGGNLYMGRLIESYRVDISQHPSYVRVVAPIIHTLISQMGNPDLGRMFLDIIHNRTWYLIPGALEVLPKERTGLVVSTDQGALQSFDEVWINSLAFESLSEDEQGKLILHEILMGLRILKFASAYKQCLSFVPYREYCDNASKKKNGDISQLTTKDYADIRAAGIQILISYQKFTYEDWEDLMASKGFSSSYRSFNLKTDRGNIRLEHLIKNIKRAFIKKSIPKYGVKWGNPNIIESCQLDFKELSNLNNFEFTLTTPTINQKIKVNLSRQETLSYSKSNFLNQKILASINLTNPWPEVQVKPGDRYIDIRLLFDLDDFIGVELQEMVYTEVSANGSKEASTLEGGLSYLCTSEDLMK